jgi:hypothetical protein
LHNPVLKPDVLKAVVYFLEGHHVRLLTLTVEVHKQRHVGVTKMSSFMVNITPNDTNLIVSQGGLVRERRNVDSLSVSVGTVTRESNFDLTLTTKDSSGLLHLMSELMRFH